MGGNPSKSSHTKKQSVIKRSDPASIEKFTLKWGPLMVVGEECKDETLQIIQRKRKLKRRFCSSLANQWSAKEYLLGFLSLHGNEDLTDLRNEVERRWRETRRTEQLSLVFYCTLRYFFENKLQFSILFSNIWHSCPLGFNYISSKYTSSSFKPRSIYLIFI